MRLILLFWGLVVSVYWKPARLPEELKLGVVVP